MPFLCEYYTCVYDLYECTDNGIGPTYESKNKHNNRRILQA